MPAMPNLVDFVFGKIIRKPIILTIKKNKQGKLYSIYSKSWKIECHSRHNQQKKLQIFETIEDFKRGKSSILVTLKVYRKM